MRGHNERAYRLDTLAAEARKGLERVEQGEENTIGGWLAYGHALNEGRALFPGDREFGEWVALSQLATRADDVEISRDDRAAAMWAASNADQFEEARQRGNPRTIRGIHAKWKEIEAERAEAERKEAEEQARKKAADETPTTYADPGATGEAFASGVSGGGFPTSDPTTEPEPDRSQIGARPEPEEATASDPHRKGLSGLSREGLEDECAGLRAEVADLRSEVEALKAERDNFKARIRDMSEGNQGRAISRLHAQIVSLKGAHKDAMATAAKETRRANFIAKERDSLRKQLGLQEIEI